MRNIKWEPILTIIISLMGVFVSWNAYKVCELQAEIAKNSLLPNIQVKEYRVVDEDTYKVENSVIEISNLEGRLNNYQSRIVTYLKCVYIDEKSNYFKADVPVAYYYFVGNSSGNNSGVIETKRSMDNATKMYEFTRSILNYNEEHENECLVLEQESCLEVSYRDLLGEKQKLYYLIDNVNVDMIDESLAIEIFEIQNNLINLDYCIDFNRYEEIAVEDLIQKIYAISNYENKNPIAETEKEKGGGVWFEKDKIEMLIYTISISLQVAGALILILCTMSTKRQDVIRRFARTRMIFRDGNTKNLSYNEEEYINSFREGYLNKVAFTYIAIGYFSGVFGEIGKSNKIFEALLIVFFSLLLLVIACSVIEIVIKKSKIINKRLTSEELEEVGIEPDMESLSNDDILSIVQQNNN